MTFSTFNPLIILFHVTYLSSILVPYLLHLFKSLNFPISCYISLLLPFCQILSFPNFSLFFICSSFLHFLSFYSTFFIHLFFSFLLSFFLPSFLPFLFIYLFIFVTIFVPSLICFVSWLWKVCCFDWFETERDRYPSEG